MTNSNRNANVSTMCMHLKLSNRRAAIEHDDY